MDEDGSTVTIVLLGDPSCGKSTFISKLSSGASSLSCPVSLSNPLPQLRDFDQPFVYSIRMYNRPYRFEIYDTASPDSYTLLEPNFVIMCYDISDRRSLINARDLWSDQVAKLYLTGKNDVPVMLLGLKRDLRMDGPDVILPQEGHRVAQELRCDLYAECSAMTGELMRQVFEDVSKKAAMTTTQVGGLSQMDCSMM